MMLPFLVFFATFTVYPVLQAIWYSFTDYNVLEPANFVGLKNYSELILHDTIFVKDIVTRKQIIDITLLTLIS